MQLRTDLSFDPVSEPGIKGDLHNDTAFEEVHIYPCGEALPSFLANIIGLRAKYPNKRILLAKVIFSDAFLNVGVVPGQAHTFCYTVDDIPVAEI